MGSPAASPRGLAFCRVCQTVPAHFLARSRVTRIAGSGSREPFRAPHRQTAPHLWVLSRSVGQIAKRRRFAVRFDRWRHGRRIRRLGRRGCDRGGGRNSWRRNRCRRRRCPCWFLCTDPLGTPNNDNPIHSALRIDISVRRSPRLRCFSISRMRCIKLGRPKTATSVWKLPQPSRRYDQSVCPHFHSKFGQIKTRLRPSDHIF